MFRMSMTYMYLYKAWGKAVENNGKERRVLRARANSLTMASEIMDLNTAKHYYTSTF